MIILPNQKLGFIAISRCASASVETALKVHNAVIIGGAPELKHIRYRDVEQFILPFLTLEQVAPPHLFAVVRHPAARLLSWYNFRAQQALAAAGGQAVVPSLAAFVDAALSNETAPLHESTMGTGILTQCDYVMDATGARRVDTLIKIEHLDALLASFVERFNVNLDSVIARLNVTSNPLAAQMPDELIRKIATSDRFGPDLDLYHQGIETLPDTLPQAKQRVKNPEKVAAKLAASQQKKAAKAAALQEQKAAKTEAAKAEAQKAKAIRLEAAKAEAQTAKTARVAAAKVEAQKAKTAKTEADMAEAQKAKTARLEAEMAEAQKAKGDKDPGKE